MSMSRQPQDTVVIRFTKVTKWIDPDNGEVVLSNRHSLAAKLVQQNALETTVVDDQGEVIGSWPTQLVDRISWIQRAGSEPPTTDELPSVGTKEWLERVKRAHPNAYRPWAEAEDEQLREESASGLSALELADLHQRRPSAIEARLKRLGITPT